MKFYIMLFILIGCSGIKVKKNELVYWDTDLGMELLQRSKAKADFAKLSNHFVSQENKIFCGLASSSIILNAIYNGQENLTHKDERSIKPSERRYLPKSFNPFYSKFTQENILNINTKQKIEMLGKPKVFNGKKVTDFGLQLHQLAKVLKSYQLKVKIRVADSMLTHKQIKSELIENLKSKDNYVLINYHRKSLGQLGGGHISPLAAYDQASDRFLIMDVNPNVAPWVWVSSESLINSMKTFDTISNRGYLLISRANP